VAARGNREIGTERIVVRKRLELGQDEARGPDFEDPSGENGTGNERLHKGERTDR
jgi:hypothetical protein